MFTHAHGHSTHSIRHHPKQVTGVAGIAAAVGAISAILFTPRRGSEVRGAIKDKGQKAKSKLGHMKAGTDKIDDSSFSDAADVKDSTKQPADDFADHVRQKGEP